VLTAFLMWIAIKFCIGGPIFIPHPKRRAKEKGDFSISSNASMGEPASIGISDAFSLSLSNSVAQTLSEGTGSAEKPVGRLRRFWHKIRADDIEGGTSSLPQEGEHLEQRVSWGRTVPEQRDESGRERVKKYVWEGV
jgi:hypothetical protein